MADYKISPSKLSGTIEPPPSKSHTLRAIIFAFLASGVSEIHNPLESPDTIAMLQAIENFGAKVEMAPLKIRITGIGGKINACQDAIHCGNSGQVLRFIGAIAALSDHHCVLTGDLSIRTLRPVKPLLDGLEQLGATAFSCLNNDKAPIIIKGPLKNGVCTVDGADSQPVSGLIIASAFAPHPITIHVTNPGEKPWIDLTLSWLDRFNIPYKRDGYNSYSLEGKAQIKGFNYTVPADLSSVSYPLCAAILTGSPLTITGIDMDDSQGDKALIYLLKEMGADITIEGGSLIIGKSHNLKGRAIDINDFVDAIAMLATLCCFAEGKTEISGASIARQKECDRVHAICCELKKMGAKISEKPDGLIIEQSPLKGAKLNTYHDHRMILALSVAALASPGSSLIQDISAVSKTYPTFAEQMRSIGANIEVMP